MSEPINGIISAWLPEQDRHRLAALGKLIEELNECASRAARCIIHGIDETDPDTGRSNREELAREMADVDACLSQVQRRLAVPALMDRARDKFAGFDRWHRLIDTHSIPGEDTAVAEAAEFPHANWDPRS